MKSLKAGRSFWTFVATGRQRWENIVVVMVQWPKEKKNLKKKGKRKRKRNRKKKKQVEESIDGVVVPFNPSLLLVSRFFFNPLKSKNNLQVNKVTKEKIDEKPIYHLILKSIIKSILILFYCRNI